MIKILYNVRAYAKFRRGTILSPRLNLGEAFECVLQPHEKKAELHMRCCTMCLAAFIWKELRLLQWRR
ncbi:MAG: hypothetical protein COW24_01210 [Candidatus Kerfeldbacteria bacterium CG15_BIG_FIL_POST_REV_8_21_14_020_45_12]|uniref:Uncharacterized protein n=1 Tax=Candidatus Kerfeldbacteria bacterium CG15_BIG_FIL_POST_REV_8_21_14_020_45_12 TaxID=2014247 RepID=A0A2M7H4T5_9BACT|nr:MAG: hypothetical protein COW24_01210 [Candidatus Kerfeldbacteria bacterium CG15_BIG_FIL_POST_REV_8_21_14_020_45_12]